MDRIYRADFTGFYIFWNSLKRCISVNTLEQYIVPIFGQDRGQNALILLLIHSDFIQSLQNSIERERFFKRGKQFSGGKFCLGKFLFTFALWWKFHNVNKIEQNKTSITGIDSLFRPATNFLIHPLDTSEKK